MGLAITVLRGLSKQAEIIKKDGELLDAETGEPLEGFFIPFNVDVNADRASDIEFAAYYAEEEIPIVSMPYSDVWLFRGYLMEIAGYIEPFDEEEEAKLPDNELPMALLRAIMPHPQGPFFEFIMFSDSEGTLGPAVCKKLHEDFLAYQEKAKEVLSGTRFEDLYDALLSGFAKALDNGCMVFE